MNPLKVVRWITRRTPVMSAVFEICAVRVEAKIRFWLLIFFLNDVCELTPATEDSGIHGDFPQIRDQYRPLLFLRLSLDQIAGLPALVARAG